MNIKEIIGTSRQDFSLEKTLDYLHQYPAEIQGLVDLATKEIKYPLPDYSSWALIHLANQNPKEVEKRLPQIIDGLLQSENQSVLRNLLKVVSLFPKIKYREEEFINRLFDFLTQPEHKIALVVYGAYQLHKYFDEYPEFKQEVVEILKMKIEKERSAAIAVALKNIQT